MSHTQPTTERTINYSDDPAYWRALGQFVAQFAGVEVAIHTFLAIQAKVSPAIGRAVFSGVRTDQAIKLIYRIWDVSGLGAGIRDEMTCVFNQLSAISTRRNLILHYGSYETSDKGRVSSTATRATRPDSVEEFSASIATLDAMSADLDKIGLHIASITVHQNLPLRERLTHFPALADAWRYTPDRQRQSPKAERQSQQAATPPR